MPLPKWCTPERREYLIRLWYKVGNACLKGHPNCPELSHYAYAQDTGVLVAVPTRRALDGVDGVRRIIDAYDIQLKTLRAYVPLRLYDYLSNQVIEDWKAQDRELRRAEIQEESRNMHRLTTRMKNNAQFNADGFYQDQPLYYKEGFGLSPMSLKPFVKVRIASSFQYLFVELDRGIFRGLSQHKRKKLLKYGHPLPDNIVKRIDDRVALCVRAYQH